MEVKWEQRLYLSSLLQQECEHHHLVWQRPKALRILEKLQSEALFEAWENWRRANWNQGSLCNRIQFSHSVVSNSLRPHGLQHARLPYPSPTPGVYSNSCALSQWCNPTVSSSVVPFSSCPESFPASMSFPFSQLFTSDGQSIGGATLASVNEYSKLIFFRIDWLISLLSKGFTRIFSSTTIWKQQFQLY